mgnify:CR=1 FL=1
MPTHEASLPGSATAVGSGSMAPTRSDLVRSLAVLVAFLASAPLVLVGSGALGGTPTSETSGGWLSATATPLAPAGPAFGIWSVIYLGLTALVVWQLLPRQRSAARHRAIGWWLVPALLGNGLWLMVTQWGQLALSVVVILGLLACLVVIAARLGTHPPLSRVDALVTDGTLGLYLGWVAVAAVANITGWLASLDVNPHPVAPYAIALLVVVAVIGVLMAYGTRGRLAPALAVARGLAWIAVGRLTSEPHSVTTGVAAAVAAVVVLGSPIVIKVRTRS